MHSTVAQALDTKIMLYYIILGTGKPFVEPECIWCHLHARIELALSTCYTLWRSTFIPASLQSWLWFPLMMLSSKRHTHTHTHARPTPPSPHCPPSDFFFFYKSVICVVFTCIWAAPQTEPASSSSFHSAAATRFFNFLLASDLYYFTQQAPPSFFLLLPPLILSPHFKAMLSALHPVCAEKQKTTIKQTFQPTLRF